MSKTIALRELIVSELRQFNRNVFYKKADKGAQFPYIVYSLDSMENNNYPRDDIELTIDIWDKRDSSEAIEVLADKIEKHFRVLNRPTPKILPTFYTESKRVLEDEEEKIKRRQIKVLIELYEV